MRQCFWYALLAMNLWAFPAISQEKFKPFRLASLSLIDGIDPFSPACLLSLEVPLQKRWGLKMEGGYVSTFGGSWVISQPMTGYKARLEARWYIEDLGKDNFYLGVQAMHKRTFSNRTDDFCRLDCLFIQRLDYSQDVNASALHATLGGIFFITERFVMDIGASGGVRYVHRYRSEIPEDASLVNGEGSFTVLRQGKFWTPSVGFTFRVGWAW